MALKGRPAGLDTVLALTATHRARFIPVVRDSKRPARKWKDQGSGDERELRGWAEKYDFAYALEKCPFIAVDLDPKNLDKKEESRAVALIKALDDCETMWSTTPSGGRHYFFRKPSDSLGSRKIHKAAGFTSPWIDYKGARSVCNCYEPNDPVPMKTMPDWIRSWVLRGHFSLPLLDRATQEELVRQASEAISSAKEGERNEVLYGQALKAASLGLSLRDALISLVPISSLRQEEATATVHNAYRQAQKLVKGVKGFTQDFMAHNHYAYVPPVGGETGPDKGAKWLRYDSDRGWIRMRGAEIRRDLKVFINERLADYKTKTSNEATAESFKDLSMLCLQDGSRWDRDVNLMGMADGSVCDLRDGRMLAPHPTTLVTMRADVSPYGDCPDWEDCIDTWSCGDREMKSWLQRLAGYVCIGGNPLSKFLFFYGRGGNGKTTYLEMLCSALGEYALPNMNSISLLMKGMDRHPTELAQIENKRLVVVEDMPVRGWNMPRIKQLTGGRTLDVRRINQDSKQIRIDATFIGQANAMPDVPGGESWRRRLAVVPWRAEIAKKDPYLTERLMAQREGILAWMLRGVGMFRAEGLRDTKDIAEETDMALSLGATPIGSFVTEHLAFRKGESVSVRDVMDAWNGWLEDQGIKDKRAVADSPQQMAKLLKGVEAPTVTDDAGNEVPLRMRKLSRAGKGLRNHLLDVELVNLPADAGSDAKTAMDLAGVGEGHEFK